MVVVAVSCLLHSLPAVPQEERQWAKWGRVKRFRGIATIESRGWRDWNDGTIVEKAKGSFASANFSGEAPRKVGYLTASFSGRYDAQRDNPGDMSNATVASLQLWPEYGDVDVAMAHELLHTVGGWKQIDAAQLVGSPRAN